MDDPSVAFGFPERYDSDWQIDTSHTVVNPGHILKTAWMLAELHLISPEASYLSGMRKLIDEILDYNLADHEAWDATNGGLFANHNWQTGKRDFAPEAAKEWWILEQAFNAGILAYYLTEEEKYLQMADELLTFLENHFVDETYGEVYIATYASGVPATDRKGDFWKAGFHSTKLGCFTYLYGQLFYHFRPVTLHYRFDSQASPQSHQLNPLAIADSRLSIQSVQYLGQAYTNFDTVARQLNLPANLAAIAPLHALIIFRVIVGAFSGKDTSRNEKPIEQEGPIPQSNCPCDKDDSHHRHPYTKEGLIDRGRLGPASSVNDVALVSLLPFAV